MIILSIRETKNTKLQFSFVTIVCRLQELDTQ